MAPPAKPAAKAADPKTKAKAAAKSVKKGDLKKKILKKRFTIAFHRCVACSSRARARVAQATRVASYGCRTETVISASHAVRGGGPPTQATRPEPARAAAAAATAQAKDPRARARAEVPARERAEAAEARRVPGAHGCVAAPRLGSRTAPQRRVPRP